MKLLTYLDSSSKSKGSKSSSKPAEKLGFLASDQVIDIEAGLDWLNSQGSAHSLKANRLPKEMIQLIQDYSGLLPRLKEVEEAYKKGNLPSACVHREKDLTLLSPIPTPLSMRDGYAFRQHVESARKGRGLPMIPEFDHFPVFYFTNHLAVTGPGDVSVQKLARERLDYELEVAIVIGKEGRNIRANEADSYIFGYMIMNDWSARALQTEEMKMNLGPAKGKDFATSLGPYLVTRDELAAYAVQGPHGERHPLKMTAKVNGKQLSEGNLQQMNWTFAQIIERASYGVTLYPGEVIGSGTVGTGCLMELNGSKITDNLWLKAGDEVLLEVEGLGLLRNFIVAAD